VGDRLGYERVSTPDQSTDLQRDALVDAGCTRVFTDHASGASTSRPQLDAMRAYLREGDTVVVWRLDRLGRSVADLIALADEFSQRGVELVSLHDQIDTTTANGRFFFQVIAAFAELERNLIVERTRAGLAAARARGRVGGRPRAS